LDFRRRATEELALPIRPHQHAAPAPRPLRIAAAADLLPPRTGPVAVRCSNRDDAETAVVLALMQV